MALKVTKDGFIILKTKADAAQALTKFQTLKAERDEVYEESGLKDMDEELVALKAAVTNFMIEKKLEQIPCDGFHGTLVKGFYDSHWLATPDDLEDQPDGSVALSTIIEKKFKSKISKPGSAARKVWFRITTRVVNHQAIEEEVAAGTFTVEEIAPAWSEKEKQPYLRIYED